MDARFSRRATSALVATMLGAAAAVVTAVAAPGAASAAPTVVTFDTPGHYSFIPPPAVTEVTFLVEGAAGGDGGCAHEELGPVAMAHGGLGGRAMATRPVTAGFPIDIHVGGRGEWGSDGGAGGFNGGGEGGQLFITFVGCGEGNFGGGGGGLSSVNVATETILVAGGGGGGGGECARANDPELPSGSPCGHELGHGGDGGGVNGGDGLPLSALTDRIFGIGGVGGTQTEGGAGDSDPSNNGSAFAGGDADFGAGSGDRAGGGGGGAGYFGGEAGTYDGSARDGGGGGGGSGFCPDPCAAFENGVQAGDGRVVLTFQAVADTEVATSLSGGGQSGPHLTVAPGTAVTDQAVLSGLNVEVAGGSVRYVVYGDASCKAVYADAGTFEVDDGEVASSSPVTFPEPGTFFWQAHYSGDDLNEPASSPCGGETVTVERLDTTLTYTGDTSEYVDRSVELSAKLVDAEDRLIRDRTITFAVTPTVSCSGVTGLDGVASCTIPAGALPAGPYTVTTTFAGDAGYAPSSDTDALTILRVPTDTEYVGGHVGRQHQPAVLAATLRDGRDGTPIVGPTIEFGFAGTPACSATTDASGFASCVYTPTQARGWHDVTASYAGDATYLPSSDTESFFVIVPTSTGRAMAVGGIAPVLGPVAIGDTGPVSTEVPGLVRKYLVWVPGALVNVSGADSIVQSRLGGSLGATVVAAANIGVGALPVIRLWGVASWSASSCEAPSEGTSSIALLQVGTQRINVNVAPNTVLNLGAIRIVINEQIPFTTADGGRGLTVNAVHITAPGINLVVASATSDIHNCTAPPAGGAK